MSTNRRELVENILADPDGDWTSEDWKQVREEMEYQWRLPHAKQATMWVGTLPRADILLRTERPPDAISGAKDNDGWYWVQTFFHGDLRASEGQCGQEELLLRGISQLLVDLGHQKPGVCQACDHAVEVLTHLKSAEPTPQETPGELVELAQVVERLGAEHSACGEHERASVLDALSTRLRFYRPEPSPEVGEIVRMMRERAESMRSPTVRSLASNGVAGLLDQYADRLSRVRGGVPREATVVWKDGYVDSGPHHVAGVYLGRHNTDSPSAFVPICGIDSQPPAAIAGVAEVANRVAEQMQAYHQRYADVLVAQSQWETWIEMLRAALEQGEPDAVGIAYTEAHEWSGDIAPAPEPADGDLSCPHGRPGGAMCPHCMGLSNTTTTHRSDVVDEVCVVVPYDEDVGNPRAYTDEHEAEAWRDEIAGACLYREVKIYGPNVAASTTTEPEGEELLCPLCPTAATEHAPGWWSCPDAGCEFHDCSVSLACLKSLHRRSAEVAEVERMLRAVSDRCTASPNTVAGLRRLITNAADKLAGSATTGKEALYIDALLARIVELENQDLERTEALVKLAKLRLCDLDRKATSATTEPHPDAGELADRLDEHAATFRDLAASMRGSELAHHALDNMARDLVDIATKVRRLQPEPAKAPAVVYVLDDTAIGVLYASRELAQDGDSSVEVFRVPVHGAAEGECGRCKALDDAMAREVESREKALAERDVLQAVLDKKGCPLCGGRVCIDAAQTPINLLSKAKQERNALQKELAAEREAHEETRNERDRLIRVDANRQARNGQLKTKIERQKSEINRLEKERQGRKKGQDGECPCDVCIPVGQGDVQACQRAVLADDGDNECDKYSRSRASKTPCKVCGRLPIDGKTSEGELSGRMHCRSYNCKNHGPLVWFTPVEWLVENRIEKDEESESLPPYPIPNQSGSQESVKQLLDNLATWSETGKAIRDKWNIMERICRFVKIGQLDAAVLIAKKDFDNE